MKLSHLVFFVIAATSTLALMAGCKSGMDDQLVGNWKANIDMPQTQVPQGMDPAMADKMKKMVQDMAANMTLQLKADKTYTMSAGPGTSDGTWSYSDSKLTLTPKTSGGTVLANPPSQVCTV